jgi:hypothetical protein
LFCGQGILGDRRFQFFKLQFQLINEAKPSGVRRAHACAELEDQ